MADGPSLGWAAIDWIEHYLVHGPGDVQGQRIELDDEFAAFVVKAYRVDPETGERNVRRAFLSRAKGRSKSGLAAMIECFDALGPARFDHWAEPGEVSDWGYEYEPGEPVGKALVYVEALNVATEEAQAGNTYDAVYYMLNADTCAPELLDDFGRIDVGLTRINLPDKRGFIEPVTSADRSKDGGKSTFIVADETHLWVLDRLRRLHGVMTRNLLKRKAASGWMLETSTMYAAGEESVAEGTHAFSKSATGKARASLLFDHRQAAESWDLTKRGERLKALAEAYGPAAAWMNLEAICDSWDDPQVSRAEFRRYWLNQPVPLIEPSSDIISSAKWAACLHPREPVAGPIVLSVETTLDRASSSIVAVASVGSAPRARVLKSGAGTKWVSAELVKIATDHPEIDAVVVDGKAQSAFLEEEIQDALDLAGLSVEVVVTNYSDLAEACATTLEYINDGTLRHGGDPALDAAVRGAEQQTMGDAWKWSRRKGGPTIAPLVAMSLALWKWLDLTNADYDPADSFG